MDHGCLTQPSPSTQPSSSWLSSAAPHFPRGLLPGRVERPPPTEFQMSQLSHSTLATVTSLRGSQAHLLIHEPLSPASLSVLVIPPVLSRIKCRCWAGPRAFLKGSLLKPGPQDIPLDIVDPWEQGTKAGGGGGGFREMKAILFAAPVPLHTQGPCTEVPFLICVSQECLPISEVSVHTAPL